MPIEPAMHGMMQLITRLGGVAVTGAKIAGRVNAAAFSPMTAFNLMPAPDIAPGVSERPIIDRALGRAGLPTYWKPTKASTGGKPVYTTRTERIQSRGGEHTASSRTPVTRKSMRGPSALRGTRDEEEIYRRRRK